MKRRWVPIPVDDPRVTHLRVHPFRGLAKYPGSGEFIGRHWVPVPPDDQLLRDIHFALRVLDEYESEARHDEAVHAQAGNTAREREWRAAANGAEDAAARLRAAFQLDQEDE